MGDVTTRSHHSSHVVHDQSRTKNRDEAGKAMRELGPVHVHVQPTAERGVAEPTTREELGHDAACLQTPEDPHELMR